MSYKRQELFLLRDDLGSLPDFDGVRVAHLFSFLCCVFDGVRVAHLFSFLCCVFGGSVLLIFLVFCVVFLVGRVAHLFSFLCCVFWWVRVAHLFSFLCCVFLMGPCCSSF